jgi:cell division protein FtsW (lipid II flippase)
VPDDRGGGHHHDREHDHAAAAAHDGALTLESRRNVELSLLLLALILSVGAYVVVGLVADNQVPAGTVGYGGTLAALFLGAHFVLRLRAPQADPVLLPSAALLNGLGLVMIRRLDYTLDPDRAAQAPAQAVWTTLGFVVFAAVIVLVRDHRQLERYPFTWLLLGAGLLLAPLLPVLGREVNGARLWISFGGIQVQPAEAAKLALVIFFAAYLKEAKELLATATYRVGPLLLPEIKYFLPLLMAWGVSLLVLLFEKDLGSSVLFFGIFIVLLYVATGRFSYVAAGLVLFGVGATFAYGFFAHVQVRVATWLDVWRYYGGRGFQLAQSLFALGTGGILGQGWNQGRPDFIPFASTDFIFAAFGEELGLVGTTAIVLVFLFMVFRGFRIALTADDEFGKLLATGLVAGLGLQVFVILGGVTRLIPLTGITLPFVSYGGSSLLSNYALIALLCRISADSAPPPPPPGEEMEPTTGEATVVR